MFLVTKITKNKSKKFSAFREIEDKARIRKIIVSVKIKNLK